MSLGTLQVEPWNVVVLQTGWEGVTDELPESRAKALGVFQGRVGAKTSPAPRNPQLGPFVHQLHPWSMRGSTELPWTLPRAIVEFGFFWAAFN